MKALPALLLNLAVLLSCSPQRPASRLLTLTGNTMGTVYSVKIVREEASTAGLDSAAVHRGIDGLLQEVNRQMSAYLPDSEISRFNRSTDAGWFPVSPGLYLVLDKAREISQVSGGAFDITVGPLVNLWGFGPEDRPELVPTADEILRRKSWVGSDQLQLRASPPAVKKARPEIYCDLAAIAKGYAVDQVAEYLEQRDFRRYLVDIGGEIKTAGRNHRGKIWMVGVSSPDDKFGIRKAVPLDHRAMATSGDYRNYFEVDGIRYSHTINPQTGRPITHSLASVTVIHETCMVADALATAIDVLGPEKGFDLAVRLELPVYLLVREAGAFREKMTAAFSKILEFPQDGK